MSESLPQLPKLYFVKAGSYTYARTYKNKWVEKKSGKGKLAVKTDAHTVGRIDSSDGIGPVNFDDSFYRLFPDLKNFNVVRSCSDKNKFVLEIKPKNPEAVLPPKPVIRVRSIGATYLLENLTARDPMLEALKDVFPDSWEEILSFAFYMVLEPDAKAERFSIFADEVKLPCSGKLSPSQVTRLLQSITADKCSEYFADYLKRLTAGHYLSNERFWALDSTSISTYAQLEEAQYGLNKQGEDLPQLNVMFVTDEKTYRPLYFQVFNGSIPDMITCTTVFEKLLNLGVHSFVAVADRGFFSADNMKAICEKGCHFVICVPFERCSSYKSCIMEAQAAMAADNLFSLHCGQDVYTAKKPVEFYGRRAYVHVFYNKAAAGDQAAAYQKRLKEVEKDYWAGRYLTPENKLFMLNNFLHNANGVFKTAGDGRHKHLLLDKAQYQQRMSCCGIFLAVSDTVKKADIAFDACINRQNIEANFKTLKDRMKIKRLRVSTEESLQGKCFIAFLAVIINSFLDRRVTQFKEQNGADSLPHHSIGAILDDLRGIKEYYFSAHHEYVVDQLSKKQEDSFKLFGVKAPIPHYEAGLAEANRTTAALKPHGEDLQRVIADFT